MDSLKRPIVPSTVEELLWSFQSIHLETSNNEPPITIKTLFQRLKGNDSNDILWIDTWYIDDLLNGGLDQIIQRNIEYWYELYWSMNYTRYSFARFRWIPDISHFEIESGTYSQRETIQLSIPMMKALLEKIQMDEQ